MTTTTPHKALVVLSGGQDSTICLFLAVDEYGPGNVHAVTYDYGQRHILELEAARQVAIRAGCMAHTVFQVPKLLGTSPLTNPNFALEQYTDFAAMEKEIGDRVEKTFVPMRNALFLTLAANYAAVYGIRDILTGVCQADNANYPDCTEQFIDAQEQAIHMALGQNHLDMVERICIRTPLLYMTKAESILYAMQIPGAYQALAYSHTAYDGQYPPNGKDHASVLRAQGFLEAGVPDPLVIRAVAEGLMEAPQTPNYTTDVITMAYNNCAR